MYDIPKKKVNSFKVVTYFGGVLVNRKVSTMYTPKWLWYIPSN